jgi:hypothetical protein
VLDFDLVSRSNLSRIVGTTARDARKARAKVDVLRELVRRIDPSIRFEGVVGDVTYMDDARRITEADFVFSATDTLFARYAFNVLVHQYLVPGIQVGAKIATKPRTGDVEVVFSAERPVTFRDGCLDCAGLIPAEGLRQEQLSSQERRSQRYLDPEDLDEQDVIDPSVITLNGVSTSLATTDFLFMATGLLPDNADLGQRIYYPQERSLRSRSTTVKPGCRWCDPAADHSAFGRGDLWPLPLRPGSYPQKMAARSLRARVLRFLAQFQLRSRP